VWRSVDLRGDGEDEEAPMSAISGKDATPVLSGLPMQRVSSAERRVTATEGDPSSFSAHPCASPVAIDVPENKLGDASALCMFGIGDSPTDAASKNTSPPPLTGLRGDTASNIDNKSFPLGFTALDAPRAGSDTY
jgi:hypothetical protein